MKQAKWHEQHPKSQYDPLNPYDTPIQMPPPHHTESDDDDTVSISNMQSAYAQHLPRASLVSTTSSNWTETAYQPTTRAVSRKRHLRHESADLADHAHAAHMHSIHSAQFKQLQERRAEYRALQEDRDQKQELKELSSKIEELKQRTDMSEIDEDNDEDEDEKLIRLQLSTA